MALTKVANRMVTGSAFNILDYGAVPNSESAASANVTAIQAAIDAASALGFGQVASVYIPSGEFVIDADITVKSYVTLFGDGDQSIIKLKADVAAGTYNMLKIVGDGDNSIVMRDFSMWGDNNNQENNPTVYGIRVSPPSSPAIYNRFENLYIKEMSSSAVYIDNGGLDNSQFINCMMRDSKGTANFLASTAERVEIMGCRIRSGKVGTGNGISFDGAGNRYCTVTDCRIDDNAGHGIIFSNTNDEMVARGNTLISNNGGGIWCDRAENSLLSDNHIVSCAPAIHVDTQGFCLVANNSIHDCGGYAIYMDNSDEMMATGNFISNCTDATKAAIYGDALTRFTISSNHIAAAQGHGIFLNNSGNGNISGNSVFNVGQGTTNFYAGIVIDNNSDGNLVQGNVVRSAATNKPKYAIWVANVGANDTVIINNVATNGVTANIQDDGTGTVTTSQNIT